MMLIRAGAMAHATGEELFYAVKSGRKEVVKIFLEAGADVNARGGLALKEAVQRDFDEIVQMLLKACLQRSEGSVKRS